MTTADPQSNAMVQVACHACLTANRVPEARLGDDPKCGKCGARLLDGAPAELREDQFDAFVARTTLPVLADFWAPWCGPCRAIPTLVLYKDGVEAKRVSGALDTAALVRLVA